MYFLYSDSSGKSKVYKDRPNCLFVLTGLIVHEKDWQKIENLLTTLKISLFADEDPEKWEIHAYEIWNNENFFEKINFPKKKEIFQGVVDLILSAEITIISSVMDKDVMNEKYSNPRVLEYAWTFLVERYDHFLNDKPNTTNNGLVFIDSDDASIELEIKKILTKLVRKGSSHQWIEHVIEDPIFIKSHLRNLIQLTDIVAYVIHRRQRGDSEFKKWFDQLTTKMYQPNGDLYKWGLKIFP